MQSNPMLDLLRDYYIQNVPANGDHYTISQIWSEWIWFDPNHNDMELQTTSCINENKAIWISIRSDRLYRAYLQTISVLKAENP